MGVIWESEQSYFTIPPFLVATLQQGSNVRCRPHAQTISYPLQRHGSLLTRFGQRIEEQQPVLVVSINRPQPVPSVHHVINRSRIWNFELARTVAKLRQERQVCGLMPEQGASSLRRVL